MRVISDIDVDAKYKEMASESLGVMLRDDVLELISWIDRVAPDIRQSKTKDLAAIFISELSHFQDWEKVKKDKEFGEKIFHCVDMLAAAVVDSIEKDGYVECLCFLKQLSDRPEESKTTEIVEQYWVLQDIIPTIKGIFLLEYEDGRKLYPIYEMVIGIAQGFECDNAHLINLVLALQMFEMTSCYAKVQESTKIRRIIKEIAEKHTITFLTLLIDNGKLLFDEEDYRDNGTMIVRKDSQVIIRNTRKDYFSGYFSPEEIKRENKLAWFVNITLNSDEELVDLSEIFLNGTQENKLDLLRMIEEKKIYNLFLPGRIIRSRTSHKIIKFLNPASANDKKIVYIHQKQKNEREGFLEILRLYAENLRGCWLFKKDYDLLTVDFYVAFYLEVVKNRWDFCTELDNGKEEFYQESLIMKFLQEILLDAKAEEGEAIFKDLYDFLLRYFDFEKMGTADLMDGKLFAFPFLGEFDDILDEYFSPQNYKLQFWGDEADQWELEEAFYQKEKRFWKIKEKKVRASKFLNADLEKIVETDEKIPEKDILVLINKEDSRIIYSDSLMQISLKLKKIHNILKSQVVKYSYRDLYLNDKTEKLLSLMNANNSNNYNTFQMFGSTKDEEINKTIYLYKILWHFQICNITSDCVNKFWRLILEKHYLGMVESEDVIEKYFADMRQFAMEEGTLVIAKESSGNDSTLFYLYRYFEYKGRNYLSWAFDEGKINHALTESEVGIYWRNKSLKKIVFMVDNLMNGVSLRKMLEYHFNGLNPEKRDYLCVEPSVREIYKHFPEVKIEVHVIFGFEKSVADLEQKYPVKIVIHKVIPEKYYSDQETVELVDELYDEAVETGVCCVFRHNNLPAKMVLPKFMCDFKNRVGLFQRCGELK